MTAASRASGRLLLALVATALVSGALGVGGAQLIRSPEQVRADAAAPEPTVLTARAESAALITRLAFAGIVEVPTGTTMTAAPGGVLTAAPVAVGDEVEPGDVVIVVNDRPVIVLMGPVPLYRPLTVGDRGPDVRRFQESLRATGRPVPLDGVFGRTTGKVVEELFRTAGFDPPQHGQPLVTPAEFAMVPRLPARVIGVAGKRGAESGTAAVRLSDRSPSIAATVNPADARMLNVGQRARCVVGDGRRAGCRVADVGAPHSTPDGVQVTVRLTTDRALPLSADGATVTIGVALRVAGRGLVVPSVAVRTRRDGAEFVEVVDGGERIRVAVDVMAEADGRAQVATSSSRLVVGAEVVVGGSTG